MSNQNLTPDERDELAYFRRRELSGMPETDFRRLIFLIRKERGCADAAD